jgi:hypothetical protein
MPNFKRASLVGSEELFRPTRPEELELLLEAVQVAKYPDRARAKPQLDKFDALDALRQKIQAVAETG